MFCSDSEPQKIFRQVQNVWTRHFEESIFIEDLIESSLDSINMASEEEQKKAWSEAIKEMAASSMKGPSGMPPGAGSAGMNFKKFESEADIETKKQRRELLAGQGLQEEEEDDLPLDNRPLYERLKEQKMKKQEEFDESRKLKNMIRGLESDETEFLEACDQAKYEEVSLQTCYSFS